MNKHCVHILFISALLVVMLGVPRVAYCALLGEVYHDYGWGADKVDPGGSDILLSDSVIVAEWSSAQFFDSFDFSSMDYSSITSFELTLTYAFTDYFLEDWSVQAGDSEYLAELEQSLYQVVTTTFIFDSSVDSFAQMVEDGIFTFLFSEDSRIDQQFALFDAKLSVYGTASPTPLPAGIWLLVTGLAGGYVFRRKFA